MDISLDKFSDDAKPLVELLFSADWPEAVADFLICQDLEEEKQERAEGILEFIGENYFNKKVLDFGTGEGHVAKELAKTASLAVGYDIKKSGSLPWEMNNNLLLTTDFNEVAAKGPYDLVILYDVLDHCVDPIDALKKVASVVNSESKVFIRFHSWMSRHATHLYKKINKAWIHLVFTDEEFALMGIKQDFVYKYFLPIITQTQWIELCGFTIINQDLVRTNVEPFFWRPEIQARLPLHKFENKFPDWQMSQVFNDYLIKLK